MTTEILTRLVPRLASTLPIFDSIAPITERIYIRKGNVRYLCDQRIMEMGKEEHQAYPVSNLGTPKTEGFKANVRTEVTHKALRL
ncbi:hypothetical protein NDU88_001795 [Pleurodeles waltl]|uniref:Uncharacterized protein n=1 Tax=Pleurodeles waltl TaxID=8319 RepID=A0AAV7KTT0_PLEWA|nr:hypothetical protein NDU88_001795 [Pleurodeles waltl]